MRRPLLSAVVALSIVTVHAQQHFGNEWIDYNARYWALDMVTEGLYKLDSATLAAAGFPIDQVDPRTIQLFGREKQIPLYVTGDTDGVLNATDFIEFYFQGNDAWLDSALYDDPQHFTNPYYSQISDTIQYFLTWNAGSVVSRVKSQSPAGYTLGQNIRPWFWYESRTLTPNFYKRGLSDPIGYTDSRINDGEGYYGLAWNNNGSNNFNPVGIGVATPNPYINALDPVPAHVKVLITGTNSASDHQGMDHHSRVRAGTGLQVYADSIWSAERAQNFKFTMANNQVGAGGTTVQFDIVHDLLTNNVNPGLASDYPDRQAMAYSVIRYAHSFNFSGETGSSAIMHWWVPNDQANAPMHIKLENYLSVPLYYVWGDTLRRIKPALEWDGYNAELPADASDSVTHVFLWPDGIWLAPLSIKPVNGNGMFTDYAAQEQDSAMVIVTHPALMNGAQQYANYRSNISWNHYNTVVADVTQLYQQYGGGIRLHPVAIRRFMGKLLNTWSTKPQALFLIGKATTAAHAGSDDLRGYRRDATAWNMCKVPSMGYPPSDALFTLGLSGNPTDLTVPVGRLAAQTDAQVLDYLAKVDSLEHIQQQGPAAWMKNILHFRGGFTPEEQIAFENYLHGYQTIAEDSLYFNAHVTKFGKPQGVIVSQATADSVAHLIAEGVTLMTFFAHANGGGFDITIDQPNNYAWHSKYPMIIGNSCYTGNIHQISSGSASEQFVLPGNAGAIAFLASIDLGVTGSLFYSTEAFYQSFCKFNYGEPIGRHMQYMDSTVLVTNGNDPLFRDGIQQFTLHGDPTIILNSPELPDFEVHDPDLVLVPEQVTADVDTFKVKVALRNIGRGTGQPFHITLERWTDQNGTNSLQVLDQVHAMQSWQDTVVFNVALLKDSGGVGLNHIQVRLDLDPELIPEFEDHTNNVADLHFQITSGDLLPVDPFNFAITPDPAPLLQASTGDPFAPVRTYVFQVDTTDLYNSPVMEQGTVSAPGGVVSWQPTGIFSLNNAHDSLVYFWRCSIDSTGNNGYDWHEFSFQHITGRTGWGQSHYYQFKKNNFGSLLLYDRPQRDFDYFTGQKNIAALVRGNSVAICKWSMDLVTQEGGVCGGVTNPAFHMAVVDPFTFEPWVGKWNTTGHHLGANTEGLPNQGCYNSNRPQKVFIFRQNEPARLDSLGWALEDSIPNGHYILLYTYVALMRDRVDTSEVHTALGQLGATDYISGAVPDSVPYIFFCRKGYPNSVQEVWGDTLTSLINLVATLDATGNSGAMMGPQSAEALSWNSLHWRMTPNVATDSARITISAVNADGLVTPIYTAQPTANTDSLSFDTIPLNPGQTERLQLTGSFWSQLLNQPKPAQTKRWQIVASPAPECAIDPPLGLFQQVDSLFEGQEGRVMVAVHNISDVNMDSLLIEARVIDENNVPHRVHYKRNAPLPAGGVVLDTIAFNLQGFGGHNALVIEANPVDTLTGHYAQREQYHFNNIAVLRFDTQRDKENPTLDVTFDGVHILNGDVVSATPEIDMRLDDENTSLLLNSMEDTALIKVFLFKPNSQGYTRIYFHDHLGNEQLRFIPANGPDNVCHIMYHPDLATDGTYTLRVQASDVSRNASGDHDYSVQFEVINRPTITEVLNYPNPFTTSTRFVFTLTGREIPTGMRIRIMTVSGRVVREIGLDEIGPLHVGRNITEYAWDGHDQFGDKLARGVYLYQVVAQLHGADIEYRETSASGYFTKGFGKMYLLR